jgi:hypothetical protein
VSACKLDGCERPAKTRGWCLAHYTRVRRTGSPGPVEVSDRIRPTCSVDGCDKPHQAHGYCLNHRRRVEKGGHPDYVGRPPSGEANASWKGDDVGYTGAHERVRAARGKVQDHACADCGATARHWSYNHRDPSELTTASGLPYSGDPAMYDPRCVPCHKRFDLAHLRAVAS